MGIRRRQWGGGVEEVERTSGQADQAENADLHVAIQSNKSNGDDALMTSGTKKRVSAKSLTRNGSLSELV